MSSKSLGSQEAFARNHLIGRCFESSKKLAPGGIIITIHDLWGIPLFNEDVEVKGDSGPVVSFKKAIKQADALIIASPEYSFSVSAALKNAQI